MSSETTNEFKVNDLVWARMKGFPPWPAKVSNPPSHLKKPKGTKSALCIFFFGTNNFGWIETHQIKSYEEHKEMLGRSAKTAQFKEACAAIEAYSQKKALGETPPEDLIEMVTVRLEPEEEIVNEDDNLDLDKKQRRGRKIKKRAFEENGQDEQKEPERRRRKPNSGKSVGIDGKQPSSSSSSNHFPRKSTAVANLLDRPLTVSKLESTPLNIKHVSQSLKDKNITPSTLKFGFLGLGIMGSGIVKNLLNSGHKVTVWNRTTDKCKGFLEAGAEQGMTPGDVIQTADITFSCVADPIAAKEMVFGNCGVLQEITASKSYVEMTGIDSETSIDISEAIASKGGRYLEAQIQGSKTEAENGDLIILAAGDRGLYEECQSCFHAMGKHSFFLGDVGNASKMDMVMQVIQGICVASLAEGMALADRSGLQLKDVMEILSLTNFNCPLVIEKGNSIIEGVYKTQQPLQHMQKDLNMSLGMAHMLEQPMPLTAAANEIYKHAKRLGYGEHDVAAVYLRARF